MKPLRFRAGMQFTIGTYFRVQSQSGRKPKARRRGAIISATFVLPWTGVSHRRATLPSASSWPLRRLTSFLRNRSSRNAASG